MNEIYFELDVDFGLIDNFISLSEKIASRKATKEEFKTARFIWRAVSNDIAAQTGRDYEHLFEGGTRFLLHDEGRLPSLNPKRVRKIFKRAWLS